TYTNLTPISAGNAGGVASGAMVPLDRFVVTFDFAILTTASMSTAAGLTFFALAAPAAQLQCKPGPNVCVLGKTPGFAVLLRTGRADGTDPTPPYLAVIDAPSFPNKIPSNRASLAVSAVESDVGNIDANAPPPDAAWHQMAIHGADGKIDVAIDGKPIVTGE